VHAPVLALLQKIGLPSAFSATIALRGVELFRKTSQTEKLLAALTPFEIDVR
jgi:hypothetical protein